LVGLVRLILTELARLVRLILKFIDDI
jgi:hypothetical protein